MTYPTGPGYPTQAELEHYEQLRLERQARAQGLKTVEQSNQPAGETTQPSAQAQWDAAFAAIGITLHGAQQ